MGNDLHLTKSCMGVSELCTQQFNTEYIHQHPIRLKKAKIKSTEEIKQKILKYVEQNRLQLYPIREKKVLETLVSVDQEHVGDKIIQMDKNIKFLQNQKRQLKRKNKNQQQKKQATQNNAKIQQQIQVNEEKVTKLNDQITKVKQKRKNLFQEAQCLLLQDLDMILEQIPHFDQNYHNVNSMLSNNLGMTNTNQKFLEVQKCDNEKQKTLTTSFNNGTNTNLRSISKNGQSIIKDTQGEKHQSIKTKMLKALHAKRERKLQEKLKQTLKIEDKKQLKRNAEIAQLGNEVLKDNELLMIVSIQCFSGIGALRNNNKTGLPSGASLFQVLVNKIKAVNMRRGCSLGIAFLVNENFVQEFNQEISKTTGLQKYTSFEKMQVNSNISNHQSDDNYQLPLQYHVIAFKNIWPSFDSEEKILLGGSEGDEIMFSTEDGDFIAFIQNSLELKQLIEKYKYVNITNVNNILAQIGDAYTLGYLQANEEIDIAVKVLKPNIEDVQLRDYFVLNENGFIEITQNKEDEDISQGKQPKTTIYMKNQNFLDIQEYYIKSRIFTTELGPLKRLLMSRITRRINENSQILSMEFYLHRSIDSIFYSKFTAFIMVDQEYEFSHVKSSLESQKSNIKKNGQIGYSRYCKKLLGLRPSEKGKEQDEMVEIDAGILHKGSQQLMKILKELKQVKQIGFPIILYSDFFNNVNKKQ